MSMDRDNGRRVCVIGAGIAGLVTAKVFKEDGFEVVVFEKEPELGGVWASSRTYPGLRANNPRETYAFSDYPYPETADDFPTAEQVRAYLKSYAEHFGLRPLICLSTEAVSVRAARDRPGEGQTYDVSVRAAGSDAALTHHFDFVVICNGVFSEPYLPHIEGRELFAGQVLHSSQFVDPAAAQGRVVVVGAGKSALDCAGWAADRAKSCTLVFRTPHWMIPRYFGRIRVDRITMTRFAELFLRYHRQSLCERVMHGPAKAVVRAWWRGFSCLDRRVLRMPDVLKPGTLLPQGYENTGTGSEFYDALKLGKLSLRRAGVSRFAGAAAIELDNGESLDADVVVFATGWRQGIPFLDSDLKSRVIKDDRLHLYRHILPPGQPGLGFVGYASSTACQLTSELAAHWLSQCFRGELALPDATAMEQEISRVLKWSSEVFPGRSQGYYIGPYVAHYLDELLSDMGLPRRRTGNFLSEYFAPLWPERYRSVGEERRRARAQ